MSSGDLKLPESDSEKMPSDIQKFTSDLIRAIPADQEFSARRFFEKYAFLAQSHSCMIDLAYEEFCRRRERGETVVPTAFARQFPKIEQSLHRVIEFDQIIHQHPSYVENFPKEHWPTAGDEDQNFVLLELIGKGVLSRVFTAKDRNRGDRIIVAKVCVRGEQEARLQGKLEHNAITDIHGVLPFGTHGLSVISMPYETRATLHHVLEELWRKNGRTECNAEHVQSLVADINSVDPLLASRTTDPYLYLQTHVATLPFRTLIAVWGAELAAALHVAHSHEVYHCDVKPGNVLLLPTLEVKLMDFNLATSSHLESQVLGGTLPYMASEQLRNVLTPGISQEQLKEPKPHTDVFGLCATLWHLITGVPPFGVAIDEDNRNASAQVFLERQRKGIPPEQLELARKRVPEELVQVLLKGMQFEPAQRTPDAYELEKGFRQVIESQLAAEKRRKERWARITRAMVFMTSAAAILTATLVIFFNSPGAYDDAIVQAINLAEKGDCSQAQDAINRIPSEWHDDRVRYLDLYCRTQIEAARRPAGREDVREQLLRMADEWHRIDLTARLRDAASLNEAFLRLQSDPNDAKAESIATAIPAETAFKSYRARVLNARDCFMEYRKLSNLFHQSSQAEASKTIREQVDRVRASSAFQDISNSSPEELLPFEAQFLLCIELANWKMLTEDRSRRDQTDRLQKLITALVPMKMSHAELRMMFMQMNCAPALESEFQISDQPGPPSGYFVIPPSRAFETKP